MPGMNPVSCPSHGRLPSWALELLIRLQITSLKGQVVYGTSMEGNTHRIDMAHFREGVYFITIRSKYFVTAVKIIKTNYP